MKNHLGAGPFLREILLVIFLLAPSPGVGGGMETEARATMPAKVGLRCELLVMGRGGTRRLTARTVVLEPGMSGTLEFDLPSGSYGRGVPVHVQVHLVTAVGEENSLTVHLSGDVTEVGEGRPGNWYTRRQVEIRPGTSALVELAPPDSRGQRLALSLTREDAGNRPLSAPLRRVDLEVEVAAVAGKEVVVLEHPRLRSLTGEMVIFAVDYEVPGEDGRGFEHVHLDLELTPGFPRAGRLPLSVALVAGFPSLSGPVMSSRSDSRLLRPGESWEMAVRPPADGDPWLRVRVMVFWQQDEERGGHDDD